MKRSTDFTSSDDEPVDVSTTREYSDFILFFVKSGRFQHHPLMDESRRQGVISLCGVERVTKMSLDRRLRPVVMSLTPGEAAQRVYLVAAVAKNVTLPELNELVRRLNESLDGLTSAEKEAFVRQIISETRSAVRPGVRYLPPNFYTDEDSGGEDPPRTDRDGNPIIDTEDETTAFVRRPGDGGRRKKNPGDISLPSTKAKLKPAETDTDSSPAKRSRKSTDTQDEDRDKAGEPDKKKTRSSDDSDVVIVEDEQALPKDVDDEDAMLGDDALDTTNPGAGTSTGVPSVVSQGDDSFLLRSEFNAQMEEMKTSLSTIKDLLETMVKLKEGGSQSEIDKLRAVLDSDDDKSHETLTLRKGHATASGGASEPPHVSHLEEQVFSYFPINKYTKPMHWLLKQETIREVIYIQVLKKVYKDPTLFKPDAEFVMKKYLTFLLSDRIQGHFGKATGGGRNLDFSRCPLPMPILNLANDMLGRLHKNRPPGAKDNAEILKVKCNETRRAKLIHSDKILGCSSQEEMALLIFLERIDFYENHQWLFPRVDPEDVKWTYQHELKKTKALTEAKGKPSLPDFDFVNYPRPTDIEASIFNGMDKGVPLESMDEAKELVRQLAHINLWMPTLPQATWQMIRTEVNPTNEEIALENQRQKKLKRNRRRKAKRRRDAYHKKQEEKQPPSDEEEDDDEDEGKSEGEDTSSDSDDGDGGPPPAGSAAGSSLRRTTIVRNPFASPPKKSSEKDSMDKQASGGKSTAKETKRDEGPIVLDNTASRHDQIQQVFGPMTSSSSSSGNGNVTYRTTQGGHLVFESSQPTEQETQDTTDTSASVNYITVMDRVPEASPSGYRLVPRRVAIADLTEQQLNEIIESHGRQESPTPGSSARQTGPPVLIQPLPPGPNASQAPASGQQILSGGNDLLQQAMAAGLAEPSMDMTASASTTVTTEQQYSMIAVDPNVAIPNSTVVSGTRTVQETSEETVTRNGHSQAQPMSPIQRYENMVDDLPSLSSDSTPTTPPTPSPTVSSGSSGSNTLQNIINGMEFPPGGPTDGGMGVGVACNNQFKPPRPLARQQVSKDNGKVSKKGKRKAAKKP